MFYKSRKLSSIVSAAPNAISRFTCYEAKLGHNNTDLENGTKLVFSDNLTRRNNVFRNLHGLKCTKASDG
jgi:hypothetical protein